MVDAVTQRAEVFQDAELYAANVAIFEELKENRRVRLVFREREARTCLICFVFLSIRVGRARLLFELPRDFSCRDETTARTLTSSPRRISDRLRAHVLSTYLDRATDEGNRPNRAVSDRRTSIDSTRSTATSVRDCRWSVQPTAGRSNRASVQAANRFTHQIHGWIRECSSPAQRERNRRNRSRCIQLGGR